MANNQVPPGFRFHPTDEELVNYYLRKKVNMEKFDLDIIRDVDLNKLEPWDLDERCRVMERTAPQTEWYFFSHKDRKYPTGSRTNRATAAGFWKATGRDKGVTCSSTGKKIGMRKTLVFYCGRAPHGQKTDWIMHEYRLLHHHHHHLINPPPPPPPPSSSSSSAPLASSSHDVSHPDSQLNPSHEEGWVVCRVFKKRIFYHKLAPNSNRSSIQLKAIENLKIKQEVAFEKQEFMDFHKVSSISMYPMHSSHKKEEEEEEDYEDGFLKSLSMRLPQLESPKISLLQSAFGIRDDDDVINCDHGGRPFDIGSPICKKIDVMLPQPFLSSDMTMLDINNKSTSFYLDDNITNNCLVDGDHWNILETLTKDHDYNQPLDMNLCTTSLLSTTSDIDIWKPLL